MKKGTKNSAPIFHSLWALIFLFFIIAAVAASCGGGGGGGGDGGGGGAPVSAPNVPQNTSATSGVQRVAINWDLVTGASSYNIYYSNTPGVTKASGTKIAGITSPYQHTQLNVGTYYYVVTAINSGGESSESSEVSAPVNLLVFVTSVSGDGDLNSWADAGGNTGLAAGDAICQARASAAGLTGTFVAWLSDSNNDAYCRVHNLAGKKSANCGQGTLPVAAGPWIRTDSFPFSETIDQLLGGKVYVPVRYDEFGNLFSVNSFYFTNTYNDGTVHPSDPSSCSNWTNNSSSAIAGGGATDLTSGMWTNHYYYSCSATSPRLLCMQTGVGPSLPSFASTGKKVFLASVSGNGNLSTWADAGGNTGLAAGDAICQARAAAVGLANAADFKAWLSSSTVDAKDRLISDGPWVRLDGVNVANNKADLIDGSLFTSISQTEAGYYLGNYGVWTGTGSDGVKSADTCSDWTSASNAVLGEMGIAGNAGSGWSAPGGGARCDGTYLHLYCLED